MDGSTARPRVDAFSVLHEPFQAVSWMATGPKVQAAREVTGPAAAGEIAPPTAPGLITEHSGE